MPVTGLEQMLQELAANNGEVEASDMHYSPFDREAEQAGLITVDLAGGAWEASAIYTLTNNGRRRMGMPIINPSPKISLSTRIRRLLSGSPKQRTLR